jgi:exoribonuclease R
MEAYKLFVVKGITKTLKVHPESLYVIQSDSNDLNAYIFVSCILSTNTEENRKENVCVQVNGDLTFVIGDRFICSVVGKKIKLLRKISNVFNYPQTEYDDIKEFYTMTTDLFALQAYKQIFGSPELYETNRERKDLSFLQTFTIDPTHSRDFDDAISIENIPDDSFFTVYVHIVDYHSILPVGNEIDDNSFLLNQTLYLPSKNFQNQIVYSLPEDFACNRLSLVKDEPRLTITTEFQIDKTSFEVLQISDYPSTIVVKNRFDYSTEELLKDPSLSELLKNVINKKKPKHFRVPIVEYTLTNSEEIDESTLKVEYTDENSTYYFNSQFIATFMVLTNEYIAKKLESYNIPNRFHPQSYRMVDEKDDDVLTDIAKLKSYQKAYYSREESGHFGLKLENYVHFTSPARRFPDVICQRIYYMKPELATRLREDGLFDVVMNYCNMRQSINKDIQRYLKKIHLSRLVLKTKPEEVFDGVVVECIKSGVTVYFPKFGFDIHLHISKIMEKTYFEFSDGKLTSDKVTLSKGQKLQLRLTSTPVKSLVSGLEFTVEKFHLQ